MFDKVELTPFQLKALESILNCYDSGYTSGLLIMPAGTGKTVLSIHAFKILLEEKHFDSMAYITSRNVMRSAFENSIKDLSISTSEAVKSYSYTELATLIENDEYGSDEFQLLIFDDIDDIHENEELKLKEIFDYFNGFKVVYARMELRSTHSMIKRIDGGVIFRYSLNQAINDGSLLTIRKEAYRHYFDNLQHYINNIEIGTDWSSSLRESFINEIGYLKGENTGYQEALELLLSGKINTAEMIEMSHRKEQLHEFHMLLNDGLYFDEKAKHENGVESVWQKYFEANPWIFGFGLNFIFNTHLDGKKFEQSIEGYSIKGRGKRTDALLKTTGLIQTLCFGEIKTHRTSLLKITKTPYRSESWAISDELAGGIAQIQRTIQKSLNNIASVLSLYDEEGFKRSDSIYLYKPKSFLIIGSLSEFKNNHGEIHEDKFSSFELFRKSISDIEIITFDELYERANAIINKKWNKTAKM